MTLDCSRCEVWHLTLYGQMAASERPAWSALRERTLTVRARETLVHAGEPPEAYHVLHDGWAFRYLVTPGGERQILWFHLPGEALTPPVERPLGYSVEALTDGRVCAIDAGAMLDCLERSHGSLKTLMSIVFSFEQFYSERIAALGKLSALQRVAHLLRHLQARLGQRGQEPGRPFDFPLRNTHVADALGLTPVHVSRVFGELRSRGVVERYQRRIRVLNQRRLDELACVSADRRFPLPPG